MANDPQYREPFKAEWITLAMFGVICLGYFIVWFIAMI